MKTGTRARVYSESNRTGGVCGEGEATCLDGGSEPKSVAVA